MPVPPANIIDIASDTDAGFWLAALPFVSFPVSDFKPLDDAERGLADRDGAVVIERARGAIIIDAADAALLTNWNLNICRKASSSSVEAYNRFTRKTARLARLITGAPNGAIVDHIDGNPLNNRRTNLRLVSASQNQCNKVVRSTAAAGFKGVWRNGPKWSASITVAGSKRHLGTFAAPEDAARAYDTAAREAFGQYAALNFPEAGEQSAHRPPSAGFASVPGSLHSTGDTL